MNKKKIREIIDFRYATDVVFQFPRLLLLNKSSGDMAAAKYQRTVIIERPFIRKSYVLAIEQNQCTIMNIMKSRFITK